MSISRTCILALLSLAPLATRADTYVFLLVGQSNMSGRGLVSQSTFTPDARIESYGDGLFGTTPGIQEATDYLRHDYGTTQTNGTLNSTAVGPGGAFADALLPTLGPSDKILLVNRAWGGTATSLWLPTATAKPASPYPSGSGTLYNQALTDFYAAMTAVTNAGETAHVGGILWHQGETDADNINQSRTETLATYHANTITILDGFRDAIDAHFGLGDNATKIVMGQIGQFYANGNGTGGDVRAEEQIIATEIGAGFANSVGLTDKGDATHFNSASQGQLGQRMESAYVAAVPEPSALGLTGMGAFALGALTRRRRVV